MSEDPKAVCTPAARPRHGQGRRGKADTLDQCQGEAQLNHKLLYYNLTWSYYCPFDQYLKLTKNGKNYHGAKIEKNLFKKFQVLKGKSKIKYDLQFCD